MWCSWPHQAAHGWCEFNPIMVRRAHHKRINSTFAPIKYIFLPLPLGEGWGEGVNSMGYSLTLTLW
jgi:hypothetical protein